MFYSALKIKSLYFLKTNFYGLKLIWLDSVNYRDSTDTLANSANNKYRPFHIKINCSRFRIDRLQQLCRVIFLIYLFVTSRNYYFWFISVVENYHNLLKNSPKFQASVTERRTSLSKRSRMFWKNLSKVPVKKLNL